MELQVKNPETGVLCKYNAKPDKWHGLHGFRILPPNSAGFFIAHRGGTWRVISGSPVRPELLANIGLALEHYPLDKQAVITDSQPDLNSNVTEDGPTPQQ
jgi:hypothetical protein